MKFISLKLFSRRFFSRSSDKTLWIEIFHWKDSSEGFLEKIPKTTSRSRPDRKLSLLKEFKRWKCFEKSPFICIANCSWQYSSSCTTSSSFQFVNWKFENRNLHIPTLKSKAKVKYNFKIRIRMPPELCRTCKITQTKLTKENCDKRKCCPKAFCSDYRVAFRAKGFLTQADRKWPGDQCTVVWIVCTR